MTINRRTFNRNVAAIGGLFFLPATALSSTTVTATVNDLLISFNLQTTFDLSPVFELGTLLQPYTAQVILPDVDLSIEAYVNKDNKDKLQIDMFGHNKQIKIFYESAPDIHSTTKLHIFETKTLKEVSLKSLNFIDHYNVKIYMEDKTIILLTDFKTKSITYTPVKPYGPNGNVTRLSI